MHLFCIGRIVFLHRMYIVESGMVLVQYGAAWCSPVCWHGDQWWRWRAVQQETRLRCRHWSGAVGRVYLFSTEIHVQGYLPPSKVALSFIQRVEFQTNKCLYGSSNDCGPNWRGAKRTTNKLSVFAQARARNTELPVLCSLNLSSIVSLSPLSYTLFHVKTRSKRFC